MRGDGQVSPRRLTSSGNCSSSDGRERRNAATSERARLQRSAHRLSRRALGCGECAGTAEHRGILAEEERGPLEPCADPDDLARGAELVELGGAKAGHAAREDVRLPERDGERGPLKGNQGLPQRRPPVDPLPGGKEAAEGALVDGLDLLAERGEAGAAQAPQDVGIAPFAFGAPGAELATDEPALPLDPHPAGPVDHHLGDGGVGEQRLDRPQAEQLVEQAEQAEGAETAKA